MSALDPLNNVVAWVIMKLHAGLGAAFGADSGAAWGLSIVILVMLIRLCLVPLFVKQVHAQRKMAQHAPQLQELRKKFKGDKQRLNEETMKFYKENKVNPLAGCLPMIPQMIVFFALFSVLRAIAAWNGKAALPYGLTKPVVESALKARIFGVHLGDKLLFAHPSPPAHVAIVIALTVVVSASTTFMTVRQSAKRGLMQTNVDPDNPMAQSQKYMQYIIPFFSLTGLYWAYGLVLYWVTTNLWTLGQQYFMFRNWSTETDGALAGATTGGASTGGATTGGSARTAQGAARTGAARPASGAARASGDGARTGASGGARTSASGARPASSSSARPKDGTTSASGRPGSGTTSASGRPGSGGARAGTRPVGTAARPASGQNGVEKHGLLRFGRPKPEPQPQNDVPVARVVRQQPVRQARSKRSGKR